MKSYPVINFSLNYACTIEMYQTCIFYKKNNKFKVQILRIIDKIHSMQTIFFLQIFNFQFIKIGRFFNLNTNMLYSFGNFITKCTAVTRSDIAFLKLVFYRQNCMENPILQPVNGRITGGSKADIKNIIYTKIIH